jgi:salicylate hydroxylase
LGALFTADTKPEQIEQKLRIYNDIRYEQAVTVLFMSRVADNKREEAMDDLHEFLPEAEMPENMFRFAWNSYPAQAAQKALSAEAAH